MSEERVTKKALRERCQMILAEHEIGVPIPVDSPDGEFLLSIVQLHPYAYLKIGCGVKYFEVQINRVRGGFSRGFWLCRVDGSRTEWSFNRCLRPLTHEQRVKTLLRQLVADEVAEFKQKQGGDKSDDVHHEIPFDKMCEVWASFRGGYERIQLAPARDGQFGRQFACRLHEFDFLRFHRTHARLSVLPREEHWRLR